MNANDTNCTCPARATRSSEAWNDLEDAMSKWLAAGLRITPVTILEDMHGLYLEASQSDAHMCITSVRTR